jgi:neutral ceramidase
MQTTSKHYITVSLIFSRSPTSYNLNPEDERKKYVDGNTQKLMTTLRFEDANGKELGALSWFPVHCTSLSVKNRLISPDNKGFAEYLFETKKKEAGLTDFVAAFAQGPEGDVTPHLDEPTCPDGKTPCSSDTTCKGKTALCTAKGPGKDMFESVQIIGTRQAEFAMKLYNDVKSSTVLRGPIVHRHQFVTPADMVPNNSSKLCTPAYGYSFAAGSK